MRDGNARREASHSDRESPSKRTVSTVQLNSTKSGITRLHHKFKKGATSIPASYVARPTDYKRRRLSPPISWHRQLRREEETRNRTRYKNELKPTTTSRRSRVVHPPRPKSESIGIGCFSHHDNAPIQRNQVRGCGHQ